MKYYSSTIRSSFGRIPRDSSLPKLIVQWCDAKHRTPCLDKIAFVNSLSVRQCPRCGSGAIIRNGKRRDGIQTYLCLCCGRKFNPFDSSCSFFCARASSVPPWTTKTPAIPVDIGLGSSSGAGRLSGWHRIVERRQH